MISWIDYYIKKTKPPLCKDCKYFEPQKNIDPEYSCELAKCKNNFESNINYVCGNYDHVFCATARSPYGICGPRAKYFEVKK